MGIQVLNDFTAATWCDSRAALAQASQEGHRLLTESGRSGAFKWDGFEIIRGRGYTCTAAGKLANASSKVEV